ncbi:Bacterial regulatory protein, luxR family [anaerobic digester metagenome]
MKLEEPVSWEKINHLVLNCGNIRDPKEFCVQIITEIRKIIPMDMARIYFLNDRLEICDQILFDVDLYWVDAYHDYFSKIDGGRYSIFNRIQKDGHYYLPNISNRVQNWNLEEGNEFVRDYLKPQGIHHSLGISLQDLYNSPKCLLIFDRIRLNKFSKKELSDIKLIMSHLENLYQNFYVPVPHLENSGNKPDICELLTMREQEVANLLKNGVTPDHISKKLCISLTTVYKHITHIHSKLNVNNRQELLVKLINL